MRNRWLSIIVAVPLSVAAGGCAHASGVRNGDKTAVTAKDSAAAKGADARGAAAAAEDAKKFSEAVQRGDAAWRAQDLDRAVYFYVQAMEKAPHDAVTLAKIGMIEDQRGNAALAEKAFAMAHEADPKEPRISERLARLRLKAGKTDSAAELYAQVLAADLNRTRALDGMGEVCLARADYGQAILFFNRALKADNPDVANVLTHRGYAKLHSNDLAGAETDLRRALSVPRRDDAWVASTDDAWRYLGDVQVLRGDTSGALVSLLNAMSTAEALNEIGVALMSINRFPEAKDYFTKAIGASAAWFEAAQKNLALVNERLRNSSG